MRLSLSFALLVITALLCGLSPNAEAARVYLPMRCTDESGDVVNGCRAYTFEAGTTTIYQTFSDKALTTNHGDFVTADSAGEFPDTYAANTQCLKIVYRLSDGATEIDTLDNVCPVLSTAEINTSLLTGTAAAEAVGTSGNALCLLNTACTYSALQTFNSNIEVNSTSAAATAAPTITLSRDSTSPALDDIIGEIVLQGKDDGTGDVDYGYLQGVIIDETDTEEDGAVEVGAILAGTLTDVLRIGSLDSSSPATTGVDLLDGDYYKNGFPAPGTPIALLEHQETSGTAGGTCTSGSDQTRTLNTEVYDPFSLASISSNQFTLQPGTYVIRWSAPGFKVNNHQTLLYDITNTTEIKRGSSEHSDHETAAESETMTVATRSHGVARVTIASATVYEIRHRCNTTRAGDGFGESGSFGTEVYLQVEIIAG